MRKLWNWWVYIFRIKRKGYTFHKGFIRTRKYKSGWNDGRPEQYEIPQITYVRPHWKKTAVRTWRKNVPQIWLPMKEKDE
jgi:hypothetical protein